VIEMSRDGCEIRCPRCGSDLVSEFHTQRGLYHCFMCNHNFRLSDVK